MLLKIYERKKMQKRTLGYLENIEKFAQSEAVISILKDFNPEVISRLDTINSIHVDHLLDEGFLPAHIAKMISGGLRSLSEFEARENGFRVRDASGDYVSGNGLYFPFTETFGQLRLDAPVKQENGKFVKYLTPIKTKSQARIPSRCQAITEGAKDAMAGSLHGKIPTGAIAGISHYRALPQGAGYHVVCDSDGWVNASVFTNLFFAGKHLNGKIVILPEIEGISKAGLCEYFKSGRTSEDYKALLDSALKPEMLLIEWGKHLGKIPVEKQFKAIRVALRLAAEFLDEIQQGYLLDNIRKATKKIQLRTLQTELAKQKGKLIECKRKELTKQVEAETNWDNHVESTVEDNLLTTVFKNGEGNWVVIDDAFYSYSGLGYWRHIGDPFINKLIAQELRHRFKIEEDGKTFPFATEKHKKSAFGFCRSALTQDNLPFNHHLIAFSNGTVDMRTGELMPHDPKNLLTTAIAAEYTPNAKCPEVFRQFMVNVFGEELIPLIRALTAMYLDPTSPYGKFAHIIGPSGSGKGTMLRLWGSFFSHEHYRSMSSFSELGTAEGRHQYLTGTRFVTFPDVGGYISGLKAFYELIDNGEMSGRALFSSHAYQKKWGTRFAIASVDHLSIENSGDGWDRRCIPLPTKPRQGLQDPWLNQKLEEVKGQIISWALAMDREDRDKLLLMPPTNERIIQAKQEQSIYSDSVRAFVDMCLRPCEREQATAENHELHDWYVAFCKAHGFSPSSITKFVSHLKTVLLQNRVERRYKRQEGKLTTISAHWNHLVPVEGAFIDANSLSDESNGYQDNASSLTPQWICVKGKCVEGGLSAFNEFWNPTPPEVELTQGNPLKQGDTGSNSQYPVSAKTQSYQCFGELQQGDTGYLGKSYLEDDQKKIEGGEEVARKNEISKTLSSVPCVTLFQDDETLDGHELWVTQGTQSQLVSGHVSLEGGVSTETSDVATIAYSPSNVGEVYSEEEAWELFYEHRPYPNPSSNNVQSSKNRFTAIRQAYKNAQTKSDLSALKREEGGKWSKEELCWVQNFLKIFAKHEYRHLMDTARIEQPSLLDLPIELPTATPQSVATETEQIAVGDTVEFTNPDGSDYFKELQGKEMEVIKIEGGTIVHCHLPNGEEECFGLRSLKKVAGFTTEINSDIEEEF